MYTLPVTAHLFSVFFCRHPGLIRRESLAAQTDVSSFSTSGLAIDLVRPLVVERAIKDLFREQEVLRLFDLMRTRLLKYAVS